MPHQQLFALNKTDRRKHDVYRLNLEDGALVPDVANTEETGHISVWVADRSLRVRAAMRSTPDGCMELLVRADDSGPWSLARHWGPEDSGRTQGFHEDDRTLYLFANHDANALRLLAYDIVSAEERVLAEDPQYDATLLLREPRSGRVQAVAFFRDRLAWQVLDDSLSPDFEALAALDPGDLSVIRSLQDQRWIAAFVKDNGPQTYYLYHRASRKSEFLFTARPELERLDLARMQPISYTSRDGLTIHGYLTLPHGVEPHALPTILLVHGGPWSRDYWTLNTIVQWLANRGYAVLQVNFRASSGYGKAFLNAGDREWGAKMQDDLTDAVHWIVGRGVADPTRVGIFGGSYGGYATLAGLAFTPDLYAVGVEMYGISNLITLRRADPPVWAATKPIRDRRMGDPDDPADQELLRSRSPFFFADRIKAPLLIGQGANDIRVPPAESEQIVAALRERGQPVEYVLYPDEGHVFIRPENRLHFFARAERFLATYLGGRAEPEDEVKGHSGVVM